MIVSHGNSNYLSISKQNGLYHIVSGIDISYILMVRITMDIKPNIAIIIFV